MSIPQFNAPSPSLSDQKILYQHEQWKIATIATLFLVLFQKVMINLCALHL